VGFYLACVHIIVTAVSLGCNVGAISLCEQQPMHLAIQYTTRKEELE